MEFNAKSVVLVFAGLEELGLATAIEVKEYLKKELDVELDIDDVKLILERLRAKDILSIDQNLRYKIAKIPAPFLSVKMSLIKKWKSKDFQKAVKDVEDIFPQGAPLVQKKGYINDYRFVELTFEIIDPILGGVPEGDEKLHLHRSNNGQPVISAGQMYGWFRSNERAIGLDANAHSHIGFCEAMPTEENIELIERTAPVVIKGRGGCGIAKYEAFKQGTQFKTYMRIPVEGIGFSSENYVHKLTELFEACAICPVRGLGANPRYNGGRVKLVTIK